MATRRTRWGAWRAIVAVVALYAVALQGFLGALRPPTVGLDALCAPERSDGPSDGGHHDACCLSLHRCAAEAGSAAPPSSATASDRPDRAPELVRYGRAEAQARPAAVSGHLGARGPPEG